METATSAFLIIQRKIKMKSSPVSFDLTEEYWKTEKYLVQHC